MSRALSNLYPIPRGARGCSRAREHRKRHTFARRSAQKGAHPGEFAVQSPGLLRPAAHTLPDGAGSVVHLRERPAGRGVPGWVGWVVYTGCTPPTIPTREAYTGRHIYPGIPTQGGLRASIIPCYSRVWRPAGLHYSLLFPGFRRSAGLLYSRYSWFPEARGPPFPGYSRFRRPADLLSPGAPAFLSPGGPRAWCTQGVCRVVA